MTTSSTNIQAEREDIAREFASAPQAQQNLLALLSEQTPPPADGSPPPMPADLLERLRGHYGNTAEEPQPETIFDAPRRATQAPGFLARLRQWFAVPAFQWGGLVTACLAVVLGILFLRPTPPAGSGGTATDQWRGGPLPESHTGPLFVWIGSADDTDRAGVADKVPDLLNATQESAVSLSRKNPEATVYSLDAAAGSVTVLLNGETTRTFPIRAATAGKASALLEALRKAQRNSAP